MARRTHCRKAEANEIFYLIFEEPLPGQRKLTSKELLVKVEKWVYMQTLGDDGESPSKFDVPL